MIKFKNKDNKKEIGLTVYSFSTVDAGNGLVPAGQYLHNLLTKYSFYENDKYKQTIDHYEIKRRVTSDFIFYIVKTEYYKSYIDTLSSIEIKELKQYDEHRIENGKIILFNGSE